MMDKKTYLKIRSELCKDLDKIVAIEKLYCGKILSIITDIADDLYIDFSVKARDLHPFWCNYPPEQRGRQPTGAAIPWLELGEKTISYNLVRDIVRTFASVRFPGLPTGGDMRYTTSDALIHLDVKLTGPNDNPNEVVVPPNQMSGRGDKWRGGVINPSWPVYYQKSGQINYNFQPKLPPFYVLDGETLVCITLFLKAVYKVEKKGFQPLTYFELVCVPNGLLMFDGPKLAKTAGLIICGKDEKSKASETKRIRIRLDPLAKIDRWRCTKIVRLNGNKWIVKNR